MPKVSLGGAKAATTMDTKKQGDVPLVEVSMEASPRNAKDGPDAPPVSFLRLFSHGTSLDWTLMAVGTLGAMANGCAMPLFALAFGNYTDGFTAVDAMAEARAAAIKFVYLSMAVFAAFYFQAACWIRTGSRQAASMRMSFLTSVMRQDVAFFENATSSGALLRSLNDDTAAYQQAVSEKLGIFIQHMTTFVVGFAVAFWRGWDMTLVLLACLPLLGAVGLALSKLSARIESSSADAYAQAQDLAQQAMLQIRTVAAFGMEQGTVDKYDKALEFPEQVGITQGLLTGLSLGSLNLVLFSAYAASLYYGATRVAANAMSGGDVLAVMMAALLGAYSLGQAAPLLQYFLAGRAAAGRLTAVDKLQPGIDVDAAGEVLQEVAGELQLQGVSFMYPNLRVQVLDNVDLHIPAGQTLALVGSSGSGKSTVVGLLQRFYDPCAGAVLLDGVDIRKLQLRWLRSQMALVSQDASLFATTIYENIAMGRPEASKQEVYEAAKAALVDSFVSMLPQGYNTHVGSRGVALSGGQRQRIAIARAILKNPRILLLDEATSALDSASEAAVSLALQNLAGTCIARDSLSSTGTPRGPADSSSSCSSGGRTVVMVAHRLSTVRHADQIVVMARGRVVEQGTHKELLADPQGAYSNLVNLQSRSGSGGGAVPHLPLASESLHPVHSVLTEQESFQSIQSMQSFHSAISGWSSSGMQSHSIGGSSSSGGNSRSWFSRVGRLRRRSQGSGLSSGGGEHTKDVEAFHTPRSHLQNVSAAAATIGKPLKAQKLPRVSKPRQPSAFWRLMGIVRSETPSLLVGALGCIGHGSMMPAFATLLTSVLAIFHASNTDEMLQQARMYAISLAAVGLGACCAVTVQFYTFGAVGTKLARRLRVMLLGAILRQEIGWHDQPEHAPAKMASLLATDTASARGAVADILGLALQTLGALAFGYGIAIYCDWRVALLVTALLPLLVSGAVIQTRYMLGSNNSSNGGSADHAAATTAVTEALAAIHVVQAYNLQDRVCSLYRRMLDAAAPQERKACHVAGLSLAYSQAAMFIVTAIVVYFGGAEVSSSRATFENMLKAFMSIVFAAMGVAQAMVSFPEIGNAGPAVQRMMRLLYPEDGSTPESSSSTVGGDTGNKVPELVLVTADDVSTHSELMHGRIADLQGHVELVRVWFSYPTRPDVRVLQDFSIDIPARSTIALVGRSGSGKSTIVSLLQRFYEPDSGTVLLDGVDIRCLDLAWLRKQMGLVSQDCLLFHGSIEDNIRYGTEHATSAQVVEAAKAAYADDFITAMPHGYKTIVGGKGSMKLSGGQRQRIAIARAIIRDPKILLLDEATSALDAASEAIVTQALNELASGSKPRLSTLPQPSLSAKSSSSSYTSASSSSSRSSSRSAAAARTKRTGRTTIIVAHRLATVTAADTIAVMSPGGKLLEMGSPVQLLGSGGKGHYAQMVMQQNHATPLAAAAAALCP